MDPRSRRMTIRQWVWWPKTGLGRGVTIAIIAIGGYWLYWAHYRYPQYYFLTSIPTQERGTPYPMRRVVEHCAGDGGYASSRIIPGVLRVTPANRAGQSRVRWTINGATYAFRLNVNDHRIHTTNETAALCVASEGW